MRTPRKKKKEKDTIEGLARPPLRSIASILHVTHPFRGGTHSAFDVSESAEGMRRLGSGHVRSAVLVVVRLLLQMAARATRFHVAVELSMPAPVERSEAPYLFNQSLLRLPELVACHG